MTFALKIGPSSQSAALVGLDLPKGGIVPAGNYVNGNRVTVQLKKSAPGSCCEMR